MGHAAPKISVLVEHQESSRTVSDQSYFFRTPDWLADRLCEARATAAMWAVVNQVGRRTRWSRLPEIISLTQFQEAIHYPKQSIADAIAKLVGLGILYEEISSNKQERHYALIDCTASECDREEGLHTITLMSGVVCPLPEGVLNSRTVTSSYYQRKHPPKIKESGLLKSRILSPKIKESGLLKTRTVAPQQLALEAAPAAPLDYVDIKKITKDNTPNGDAAHAALAPNENQKQSYQTQEHTPGEEPESKDKLHPSKEENILPTVEFNTYQLALMPVAAMPTSAVPMKQIGCSASARSTKRAAKKDVDSEVEAYKQQLKRIWLDYPDPRVVKPESPSEWSAFHDGMNRLALKVMPDDLPDLIFAMLDWSSGRYLPTPIKMASKLGEVRATLAVLRGGGTRFAQKKTLIQVVSEQQQEDGATEMDMSSTDGSDTDTTGDPSTELVDDPEWIAQLCRSVPDAEGVRQRRDVQMLWGFVRDALRPGLNTARRQHLDALVPAWNPTNPRELVLLASTSYTIRFANIAMRREINELIGKLLSRFFDCVQFAFVRQEVIDQV